MELKELLTPFIETAQECFDAMVNAPLKLKDMAFAEARRRQNGLVAMIPMTGDLQGLIALSLGTEEALKTVSRFVGEPVTEMDEGACDAAGEIINIIAGGKSKIRGRQVQMGLPSVIVGQPMLLALPRDLPIVDIRFEAAEIGAVNLLICLKMG